MSMQFADLIAPIAVSDFLEKWYGREPFHAPAPVNHGRSGLLNWARINELLQVRTHWTPANLKLILNSRPVAPDLYLQSLDSRPDQPSLANLSKVAFFLSMGASLVGNFIDDVDPGVRRLAASIGDTLSARVSANVYCSFQSIQAFASHCDLHDVIALQCEGMKTWTIYENRAEAPVESLSGDGAQEMIDGAKGRPLMHVKMTPGDILYIPRGYYHDALASSDASLHVTFSIAPLTGLAALDLLSEHCRNDPAFRHYLPDARAGDGSALRQQLLDLRDKISDILTAPLFHAELAQRQRQLVPNTVVPSLPHRMLLRFLIRSEVPAHIERRAGSAFLKTPRDEIDVSTHAAAAEWMIWRRGFAVEEALAEFPHMNAGELEQLIATLERLQVLQPHQPGL